MPESKTGVKIKPQDAILRVTLAAAEFEQHIASKSASSSPLVFHRYEIIVKAILSVRGKCERRMSAVLSITELYCRETQRGLVAGFPKSGP